MFIYVIVCNETLKIYIGQHKKENLGKYLSQKFYDAHYYSGKRSHVYAAMRKYPRDSWSIHSLVSDLQTRAECDEWERHYIQVLNAQHPEVGYNLCDGGEGFTGPHSVEAKRKMSASQIGRRHSPESRAKMRTKRSLEHRENIRLSKIGNKNAAGNTNRLGMKSSEETKARVSASLMGNTNGLGIKHSEEHKAKIGAASRRMWAQRKALG